MEAIITNINSGKKRIENLDFEEYYFFGSNTERIEPGHPQVYAKAVENFMKDFCWQTIYAIQSNGPKTDLSASTDSVVKQAQHDAIQYILDYLSEKQQSITL